MNEIRMSSFPANAKNLKLPDREEEIANLVDLMDLINDKV